MSQFKGKVVFITGAAQRLGKELAIAFAQEGATIAAHYNTAHKEAHALKQLLEKKTKIELFQYDLSNPKGIPGLVRRVTQKFKKIDILIHNASVFYETKFSNVTQKDWDFILNTNLKSAFFLTQAVTRRMKNGKIIFITDASGPKTRGNYLPYWISKSGLETFSETLAKVLMPHIQVNCIAPGPIGFKEDLKRFRKDITVSQQALCEAALYVAAPGTHLTGHTLLLDAGRRFVQ